jgi:hypothetical protein
MAAELAPRWVLRRQNSFPTRTLKLACTGRSCDGRCLRHGVLLPSDKGAAGCCATPYAAC